jgi:hypothetical protein
MFNIPRPVPSTPSARCGFEHPGLRVEVGDNTVTIEADSAALSAWANDASWPGSDLAELDYLRLTFDSVGLIKSTHYEGSADELNALVSDAADAVLPPNHPCWFLRSAGSEQSPAPPRSRR